MEHKVFKLKFYDDDSNEKNDIVNSLNLEIGIDQWTSIGKIAGITRKISILENDLIVIENYIPEKHDSIINELILKYG